MKTSLIALAVAACLLAGWIGTPTQAAPAANPQPGGTILFTSNELSWDDLYTMDGQGGSIKRLTKIGRIGSARYSPDGKRIVFDRVESDLPAHNTDIYVMNADGSNVHNVTNSTDFTEWSPDWSPDGSRIVFSGRRNVDADSQLYVMNSDGNGRSLLIGINNNNDYPAWSPDGKKIAFVSYFGGHGARMRDQSDVFVVNADGSNPVNVTNRGEHFAFPVWAPGGQEIWYSRLTRNRTVREGWLVLRMDANGGNNVCVIGCMGFVARDSNNAFALRGNQILFSGWETGNWNIYLANVDGTGIEKLTNQPWDEKGQDWKP